MKKRINLMMILQNRIVSLGAINFIVIIVSSLIWSNSFATIANAQSVALNMAVNAIVCIGMLVVLAAGGIDLSVGAVVALSGALCANLMMHHNVPMVIAIIIALAVAGLVGVVNGILIAVVGVNPMIVTLSMQGLIRGIAMLIAGSGITNLPSVFTGLVGWKIGGFRAPVFYMIILCAIYSFLVVKTKFFRRFYYIGGNEKAAQLSGINVIQTNVLGYVNSALLAGLAGIIQVARMGAAVSSIGEGMEMTAITACVLGGASLTGGYGTVLGAAFGVLFTSLVDNIMIMGRVASSWQDIVVGIILIVAVSTDVIIKRNRIRIKK